MLKRICFISLIGFCLLISLQGSMCENTKVESGDPDTKTTPSTTPYTSSAGKNTHSSLPTIRFYKIQEGAWKDKSMVAFYYPGEGKDTEWDKYCGCGCFGNFWKSTVMITLNSKNYEFKCAEAAFQASKYSEKVIEFLNLDGDGAYNKKQKLGKGDLSYGGVGRVRRMYEILQSKFSDVELKKQLLDTGEAYLLEHNMQADRDYFWSDNKDGKGYNALGYLLMFLRAEIAGNPITADVDGLYTIETIEKWSENEIKWSQQVKNNKKDRNDTTYFGQAHQAIQAAVKAIGKS